MNRSIIAGAALLAALGACSGDGATDASDACPVDEVTDADLDGAPADVDCDDNDPLRAPGFAEVCGDGIDNNCDDVVDDRGDGATALWYADDDEDGWGDGATQQLVCAGWDPGSLWADRSGDCGPQDGTVHPDAIDDTCDLRDDNCDGSVDESADWIYWYPDEDDDEFGVWTDFPLYSCEFQSALADNWDDCDDTRGFINPDAYEVPGDGGDANCNGLDDT